MPKLTIGDCEGVILTDEEYKELEDEIKEWIKHYPWLKKPALKSLLKKTLSLGKRIDKLERWMDTIADKKQRAGAVFLYTKLLGRWRMMLGSLGVSHTAQQHIKKTRGSQSPQEILEEIEENVQLEE